MAEKVSFFDKDRGFFSSATPMDIKALVAEGADPHEQRRDSSVIGQFCENTNVDAVRCLIKDYKVLPPLDNAPGERESDQIPSISRKSLLINCATASTSMMSERNRKALFEIAKLLLSSGADRLFDSPLERRHPTILCRHNSEYTHYLTPMQKLLLEYGYPLIRIENRIYETCANELIEALKQQKADVAAVDEWFKECTPYPKKDEFLDPLPDHDEPAIVTIIRTGRENLMKAFQPLEKWTRNENRADLREIFSVVPRTDFFKQRMMMLEDALVLENKKQARIREERDNEEDAKAKKTRTEKPVATRLTLAQKRQALSEILKSVTSPKLKQEIDDSVRKRWGWKPRSKRSSR